MKEQQNMLKKLSGLYDNPFSDLKAEALVSSLLSGVTMVRFGGSIAKLVPVSGWIKGMVSMSMTAGATTFAIGQMATYYLENDGNLDNAFGKKAKEAFYEAVDQGKEFVEEVTEEIENKSKEFVEEITEGLEKEADVKETLLAKLEELHKAGIITEKEFERKKRKIEKM